MDLSLGSESGLEVLTSIKKMWPKCPVIMITGFGTITQDEVYGDGQCEAIAFNQDGMQLWFTCEEKNGPIGKSDCLTWVNDTTGETTTEESSGCQNGTPLWWLLMLVFYCKMRISSPTISRTETLPP